MLPALQQRFDVLEERRHSLLTRLRALDAGLVRYHPAANSWSMLQVVQHLILVEQLIMKGMTSGNRPKVRRRWWHRIGASMVAFVFRHGFRVPVPTRRVMPQGEVPLDDSSLTWDDLRRQLRAFLESSTVESAGNLGLHHPISGPLDIASSLDFIQTHFDHHLRQVARIEASAGRAAQSH